MFKLFVNITFIGVIIIVFNLMYSSYYYKNPYVPSGVDLRGTDSYGRNFEGGLKDIFTLYLIENAVALAVLLPYSFRRNYWIRVMILQILFGGWMFLLLMTAMHSGSLYMLNIFGVFLINVLIFILLITSIIADTKNRKRFENL